MKKLKIYRVINDTRKSHGMVNTFVRFAWNGDEETIIAKDIKTGKLIKFDVKDLVEATAEYVKETFEQAALFCWSYVAGHFRCKCNKRGSMVCNGSVRNNQLRLLHGLQNTKRRILTFKTKKNYEKF